MSATVDPQPPTDLPTPRQKPNGVDRALQAATVAGAIAGVASFLTEHPTAGLRLMAGSLLVGGVALAFRWRTAGSARFGFTSALVLALIGAGVFGWSVRPGAAPQSVALAPSPTTTGPHPAPDSTSVTVHRAETTVPLSATSEIDLDSLAPDWDVTGHDETGRTDLLFDGDGLRPINGARLREAAADGPDFCQRATVPFQLDRSTPEREVMFTCAITNDGRFASVRFEKRGVDYSSPDYRRITLVIRVYNRPV